MDKSIFSHEQRVLQQLLRQMRIESGLRQEDLAEKLAEPQSFISKYESGERRLDLIELRQICSVLGCSLTHLIDRFEVYLKTCSHTEISSDSP
jgi:transcriptional regulator with XRE-family HTH domain